MIDLNDTIRMIYKVLPIYEENQDHIKKYINALSDALICVLGEIYLTRPNIPLELLAVRKRLGGLYEMGVDAKHNDVRECVFMCTNTLERLMGKEG